jgi:uncharacterized protein DUF4262
MCLRCQGYSEAEVLDHYRALIREHGWAVVQVTGLVGFAYTVGLTRFHGHPELLVSGLSPAHAPARLSEFASEVASGRRFVAGVLREGPGQHRTQFLQVDEPVELVIAQAVYARATGVPALQVVLSDHQGRWPWTPGWRGCAGEAVQPLFGSPVHR